MQAKKRYILVFVSCAFLAYCYFGGYRLKRTRTTFQTNSLGRKEHIIVPLNLPSFLSSSELNGLSVSHIFENAIANESPVHPSLNNNHLQTNQNTIHPGANISVVTIPNNNKAKGMYKTKIL